MAAVVKEYGTLGQFLLSRQGLIMQMIEVWGNGGC